MPLRSSSLIPQPSIASAPARILDATEGQEQLGKTAGKDATADKATYVKIHGLEGARRMAAELRAQAEAALEPLGQRAFLLRAIAQRIVERRG
jgi:geranylgeranyl pyrophosphate synthase